MKFLREILTICAGLVVLALTAALAAPYFIDWSVQRSRIEAGLQAALGAPVRIRGAVDLRLLPAPRLVLADAQVGAEGGAIVAQASRVVIELAPMALLRGQFRFTEARVEQPDITISPQANFSGAASDRGVADAIAFEALTFSNGRIRIARSGGNPLVFSDVALEASTDALTGPWRGSGQARVNGHMVPFYFATAAREGARVRLKFTAEGRENTPRLDFDGAATLGEGLAASSLEGVAKIAGRASGVFSTPAAYEIAGPLRLDISQALMESFELRGGVEDRTFAAAGRAAFNFETGKADIALDAPRLDLDYLAGAREQPGGAWSDVVALARRLASGGEPIAAADFAFKSASVVLGGEALGDVALSLSHGEPALRLIARASLPGRSAIAMDGTFETGMAARFKGAASFETRDPARFAQWLGPAYADAGRLASLPFQRLSGKGDVEISAAAFFSRNAVLQLDRSEFSGLVSAARALAGERARLTLDLQSPALDLDAAPDLTPALQASGDVDLSLALEARAVRLARVGQGMVDAGRIVVRARRDDQRLEVEQFDVSGLGGANLSVRGESDAQGARVALRLDAERLVEFAALVQRVAPGVWSDALARRAVALSPARLEISAQAVRKDGALQPRAFEVKGSARGTRIAGSFTPSGDAADSGAGQLALASAQTPMLLRQLGLETLPLEGLPEGRIELDASGSFSAGFEGRVRASLAGTALEWQGRAQGLITAPGKRSPEIEGRVTAATRDASPLLQALALALPDASLRAPVDLSGVLGLRDGRWSLDGLKGEAMGSRFTGALAYAPQAAPGRLLTGQINIDRMAVEAVAALVLGPRPPAKPDMIWPDFRFAAAVADPPPSQIFVNADRLALPGGVEGEAARFMLDLAPGAAQVSDLQFRLPSGTVTGKGSLRRDKGAASVNGDLRYEGRVAAGGDFAGDARAQIQFAGSGASYAAIVSGLAGKGRVTFPALRIARADRGALARAIGESLDILDITEGKILALLERELARGSFDLEGAGFDLALAGGQIAVSAPQTPFSATVDLRRMALDAALRLEAPAPDGWRGAAPEAVLRWQGLPGALRRSLNIASLLNGLGARAIEREAARIELLEFDARERAAFNRRRRADEFQRQRDTEIAAWHVEQERRALEEKKREEEAARQRQIEEQRAAARRAEAERERREKEKMTAPTARPQGAPLQLSPAPAPLPAAPPLNDPAALGRY